MRIRKAVAGGLTALLAIAVLAGCGDAPDSSAAGGDDGGDETPAASDFLPCIVSDAGGFDDKSFNQLSYEGVQQAADELGVEFNDVESNSENDYAPNIQSLVDEGCDAIVTVGFALAAATKESAAANPDIDYILIDDAADGGDDGATFDGQADEPNIKPLLYDTAQAAFLAGYAGRRLHQDRCHRHLRRSAVPDRHDLHGRLQAGRRVLRQGEGQGRQGRRLEGGDKGSFTGGFEANETATNTARQLLDQDVDVILPVGGPIYQGALTAIADSGADVAMIGVDADVFETDPNTQDVILTSILKNMKISTYEAIMAAG